MNDRSLATLLAELDAELGRKNDAGAAAEEILSCVEARAPGSVLRSAASIQLRRLGGAIAAQG